MTSKEALNKIWEFIETHYNEKDDYPKKLYDILEDVEQKLEKLERLEYVIWLMVDYYLIDFYELEYFMKNEEIEAIQKAFKEVKDKIKRSSYDK